MSDIQKEIEHFDKKADSLLEGGFKNLLIDSPYKHLAGSKIAFDYLMKQLGSLKGKTILDVGCGSGWLSVYFSKMGAKFVHGFDVSPRMIEVAKKRAEASRISDRVSFECNIAEEMQFEREAFDYVVGISVLHHIDLKVFSSKMHDILKQDGKALFIEPLGENKLIEFVRNAINLRLLGERTEDERPLMLEDIGKFSDLFKVRHREFQLFGGLARYIGDDLAHFAGLNLIDKAIFKIFPSIEKKARLSVITLLLAKS